MTLAVFVFQEYRTGNIHAWIFTHVLVITFGVGTSVEGLFVNGIQYVNKQNILLGRTPPLGKSWLFMGLLFGVLSAGAAGTLTSDIATSPSVESVPFAVLDTLTAVLLIVFVFLIRYDPKRLKSGKKN